MDIWSHGGKVPLNCWLLSLSFPFNFVLLEIILSIFWVQKGRNVTKAFLKSFINRMQPLSFYKCACEYTQIRTHSCPSASRGAGPRTPSGTKTQGGSSPLYKAMYSIGIKSAHTRPHSSTSNHPEVAHNTHYNAQTVGTSVTLDCLGDNDKKKSVHVRNRPAVGLATSCTSAALSSFFLNIFISNGGTHQCGTHG